MKTISLIEDCPLTFLDVSDIKDVPKRLLDLKKWKEDYESVVNELYKRTALLDILNDPLDMQTSNILLDEFKKEGLRKVRQPLMVLDKMENKYEELKLALDNHYKNFSKEEKLLWLQNIDFFITPDLLKILESMSTDSTHHQLVGGVSRMGKSTFFRWLASQMKAEIRENYTYRPFIHVEGTTDLRSLIPFYQRLILHYGGRYRGNHYGREYNLLDMCTGLMMVARAKYVVIDEIGTMAVNIIQRKLIEFANSAPPGLKIIGTSVNPSVFTEGDDELLGRFGHPFYLEKYNEENLENLLYFFDLILPFSKSLLHTTQLGTIKGKTVPGLCKLIKELTGGVLGDIVDLIKNSAIETIEKGGSDSGISPEVLDETWKKLKNGG